MKTSALRRWLREERAEENLDALARAIPTSWRRFLDDWTVWSFLDGIVLVPPLPPAVVLIR